MVSSRNTIATPPGATIKEQLVDRGMSQKEFAARMGMSEKHISRLINGDVQLTSDVAVRLEMVLSVPAKFWNNLEAIYREKLAKVKIENDMDEDIELSKKFPYKEMVKNGWIPDTKQPSERVINLRKYFEVVKLNLLNDSQITRIACRKLSESEKSYYALITWAQKAKLNARNINTSTIDINRLHSVLPQIRNMTTIPPAEFCPKLVELLASCGVALVFLPHIGGSFLHGATFYDGNKIVVGLTVRGRDADKFWFSLFHEMAHIIYNHIGQTNGTSDSDELEADSFAKNTLIPQNEFNHFVTVRNFSKESILLFSRKVGIDPGIVVGRLQKEKYIDYTWHNDLKTKYAIK